MNSPIRRPPIVPPYMGNRDAPATPPPPPKTASPTREQAGPRPLPPPRTERGKSSPAPAPPPPGGLLSGGSAPGGGRSPAAGSASRGRASGRAAGVENSRQEGRVSPAVASTALPHGPAAPPASPRPCCRVGGQRARLPLGSDWCYSPRVGRERSGAFLLRAPARPRRAGRRQRGRRRLRGGCGAPPLSGGRRPFRSAERTLFWRPRSPRRGPSLSPPSSASRPSPLPPQVPPSLVTGRCINPVPRRIPPPRETLVLWPPGRKPAASGSLGLSAPAADRPPGTTPTPPAFPRSLSPRGVPGTVPTGLFPSLPGPGCRKNASRRRRRS